MESRIGDSPIPVPMSKLRGVAEQLIRGAGNELEVEPPEVLQRRIQIISSQREQMQQMEIELRSQIIARAEIEDINTLTIAREEQTHEKEHNIIQQLRRLVDEKDKELIEVRRDNELKQKQIIEYEEQYRVAQETILSKDEQLRKAREWLARIQAIDFSQLATLQAELRGQTAHSQEIDALPPPTVQPSELTVQIGQQQARPETSLHTDLQGANTLPLDNCLVNPISENEVQQDKIHCKHFRNLAYDESNNLDENLTYKDITREDILGMSFNYVEAAESFYKRYAMAMGFTIRRQDIRKNVGGVLVMLRWVCNKQGRRKDKFLEGESRLRKPRPITRVGCPVTLQINRECGKWIVRQAVIEHNHELAPPIEACLLPDKVLIKRAKTSKAIENTEDSGE